MSRETAIQYAELMISRSPFLRERCKDIAQYTDPDCPLPVGFHGVIGQQIAKDYDALPAREWAEISALIESGLASSDDMVGTAVATGLIEVLVHVGEETPGLWPRIEADLGPAAREHADAYRNWGQGMSMQRPGH